MISDLNYLRADLGCSIQSICKHLRNKAYKDESLRTGAEYMLTQLVMFEDELGMAISYYNSVIKALTEYNNTGDFENEWAEEPQSIWQYCRDYFERMECPLGQSTEELDNWVSEFAERQQMMFKKFDTQFPNTSYQVTEHATTGEIAIQVASEETKFDQSTRLFLVNIELSNCLREFNECMKRVHYLLKLEASPETILQVALGKE